MAAGMTRRPGVEDHPRGRSVVGAGGRGLAGSPLAGGWAATGCGSTRSEMGTPCDADGCSTPMLPFSAGRLMERAFAEMARLRATPEPGTVRYPASPA